MTTQPLKTCLSFGNKLYPLNCSSCGIELTELKEMYPNGTPMPIKCDNCKHKQDQETRFQVFKDRYNEILLHLPVIYREHMNFELNMETYKKFKDWFYNKNQWAIIFYGTTGNGKTTRALKSFCKAYIFLGIRGEFIEAPRLAKRLRSDAMNGKNPEEQFRYFSQVKFLIIDDFLTEQDDHRDKGLIESLISEREKNFRKTLFTANKTPDQIFENENGYSERLKSRLSKIQKFGFFDDDYRKQNQG